MDCYRLLREMVKLEIGRRIVYEKNTGNVVIDLGEIQGGVSPRPILGDIAYTDLEHGQNADEFKRCVKWHIDPTTKQPVFDELTEPIQTPEERIAELENQLLIAEGVI